MARDFPELRSAAAESLIGRAITWMMATCRAAAEDAVVVRTYRDARAAVQRAAPETRVQTVAMMLAIAAIATIALSAMTPADLRTTLPWYGLAIAAAMAALAAASPGIVVRYWEHSRLRRITHWLLDA